MFSVTFLLSEAGYIAPTLKVSTPWTESKVALYQYVVNQSLLIKLNITLQVEKCARFHIVCSERLVEVDSHDFDKKLNDENLTKCIQTLKHMYYDLSIQGRNERGSQNCPSYDFS